jgi:hypothetical protein
VGEFEERQAKPRPPGSRGVLLSRKRASARVAGASYVLLVGQPAMQLTGGLIDLQARILIQRPTGNGDKPFRSPRHPCRPGAAGRNKGPVRDNKSLTFLTSLSFPRNPNINRLASLTTMSTDSAHLPPLPPSTTRPAVASGSSPAPRGALAGRLSSPRSRPAKPSTRQRGTRPGSSTWSSSTRDCTRAPSTSAIPRPPARR